MPEFKSRTYANPRRLPRRNHYQEGPGFLFVATQGGRPSESTVGAGPAAIVRRRRAALRRWADGERPGTICADTGCSRASLFPWRTRYAQGLAALLDRPRVGRASDLPPALERLILTVRLLTYWNSRRIAAEFRRRGVWPLGHGQVDRILDRHASRPDQSAAAPTEPRLGLFRSTLASDPALATCSSSAAAIRKPSGKGDTELGHPDHEGAGGGGPTFRDGFPRG